MGASRRAHHARVEAERRAAAEVANIERVMVESQQRMQQLAESYRPPALPEPPPTPVASTVSTAEGAGIRASRRRSTRRVSGGASSLRIPLNITPSSTSGLNIG